MTKDKTALITGSSRGIGKAIALAFAKEGYHIILNGSTQLNDLLRTKEEIEQHGVKCLPILADVSDYDRVTDMFEEIKLFFHQLDVVVNNAGISKIGLFTEMSESDWDQMMSINLKSVFNICHHCVPMMLSAQSGHIINISSVWGMTGASCEVAYSASKGGMNALTKALAKELAPSRIMVNAIACGVIKTDMNQWLSDEEEAALIQDIPANRFGTPEEVAHLCLYLASNHSSYLTGQVIPLDGGWL